MSDTAINQILQYGLAADRALFTPDPPLIAGNPVQTLYLWKDTDAGEELYWWDGATWQIAATSGTGITELTGDVTAGPGSGSQVATINPDLTTKSLQFMFDGQGADITVGKTVYFQAQAPGEMTDWVIGADATGDIVIDVWNSGASYPPTIADTITGTDTPELTAADTDTDTTAGWSPTAIAAGDWIAASVLSCTGISWAILQVRVTP